MSQEKNFRFGVREHAMGAICNGIALHNKGFIPYCATFFIFTDYMRASIRMAALSEVSIVCGWLQSECRLNPRGGGGGAQRLCKGF